MDKFHRAKLDKYCDDLAKQINLEILLPKLIDNGVYNKDDVNLERWRKNVKDPKTVKDVITTIKTRGPDAFRNFVLSLRQSGYEHLARILNENSETSKVLQPKQSNDNNQQNRVYCNSNENGNCINEDVDDNYFKIMGQTKEKLKIRVKKATHFRDGPDIGEIERYPMRSNPRGKVLIINNVDFVHLNNRDGALIDEMNLEDLFKQMGFDVSTHRNLTGKQIKELFKELSTKIKFDGFHSFFTVICSHGDHVQLNDCEYTEIHGTDYGMSDYEKVSDFDIMENFTSTNCLDLAGKPKVFIFQACRGINHQKRTTTDGIDSKVLEASEREKIFLMDQKTKTSRPYSDTLSVYSTVPKYVSFRDIYTGSWFINILCEVFMKYAHKLHIQDLFNLVDSRLQEIQHEGDCQTLVCRNVGFNKHCYLNPGLFEELELDN